MVSWVHILSNTHVDHVCLCRCTVFPYAKIITQVQRIENGEDDSSNPDRVPFINAAANGLTVLEDIHSPFVQYQCGFDVDVSFHMHPNGFT